VNKPICVVNRTSSFWTTPCQL